MVITPRSALVAIAALMTLDTAAATQGTALPDATRTLTDRFQFTAAEVAQVDQAQPVAKLLSTSGRDELAVVGAIRIDGDMQRLVHWVRDIAAFRTAAELAHATVVPQPVTDAAFAGFVPDARDLAALRACRVGACDLRLSQRALQAIEAVRWDDAQSSQQAAQVLRQMLADYARAYLTGGDAALGTYHDQKAPRVAADDFRTLLAGAANLKLLVPELTQYLEHFPQASLQGADQLLYWTTVSEGSNPVFTLHQLVVYPKSQAEILIADKTIYASRSIDAAALVLSVQSAPAGRAFYVTGAARVKSAKLTGMTARVLRSRLEKETLEAVRVYLAWIRDSLALAA